MDFEQAIKASLLNIAKHGDTDIFPLPFESHTFFDCLDKCVDLIKEIHKNFENHIATYPPFAIVTLTQVGYTGFRWATQIEPFWNAYYLALVISIAEEIEKRRIPESEGIVFSYRYAWNEKDAKLFKDVAWRDYKSRSLELSKEANYIAVTDIADFYPRVNHHRIENALQRITGSHEKPNKIMALLSNFSNGVSYGLPVGGPASRILSEMALIPVDEHLHRRRVVFCRYADDYTIFCKSKSEAYKSLVLLSEKLYNEGLVLQKNKTHIKTKEEFQETSKVFEPKEEGVEPDNPTEEEKLLNISIRFDPYSPTADEDYSKLKTAVGEVDILGILGREVAKTNIDPTVTKQAISAIRALEPAEQDGAIRTLLDSANLNVLAPTFVHVLRAVRGLYENLQDDTQDFVDAALIRIYEEDSHLLCVDLNLSYFIQTLSLKQTSRKEEILVELFDKPSSLTSPLLRRQIILIMARWNSYWWLTDIKNKYAGLSEWEKRAFLLASYVLGDEGKHWRSHTKQTWSPMDCLVRDWFSEKYSERGMIPL